MKLHHFARRLSPFLTAYLLLVSLGLPLHKVYCACRGESKISLFAAEHNCGHAVKAEAADAVKPLLKTSCCSAAKSSCLVTEASNEDHRCGDNDETILAKLSADYLVEKQDLLLGQAVGVLPVPLVQELLPPVVFAAKAVPIRGPTPPPLPFGRDLLLRRQLMLC